MNERKFFKMVKTRFEKYVSEVKKSEKITFDLGTKLHTKLKKKHMLTPQEVFFLGAIKRCGKDT